MKKRCGIKNHNWTDIKLRGLQPLLYCLVLQCTECKLILGKIKSYGTGRDPGQYDDEKDMANQETYLTSKMWEFT